MIKTIIQQNREVATGIFSLTFRRFFDFLPGQVVKITTDNAVAPRMYSIASGTQDDDIQLIYDIKPEGELTNILKKMRQGDLFYVSQPFGQFICRDDNACWIANGTGIAPFYSMFKSGIKNQVNLIHGARNPEAFLFEKEFSDQLQNRYKQCCSAHPKDNAFKGRVSDYLRQLPELPVAGKFYLCGSAEMVVEVRDILIERNVEYGNIFSEIYF